MALHLLDVHMRLTHLLSHMLLRFGHLILDVLLRLEHLLLHVLLRLSHMLLDMLLRLEHLLFLALTPSDTSLTPAATSP